MPLKLAVVTPTAEALALECSEVVLPGAQGEMDLLPGHLALITALKPGVLSVVQGGKRGNYFVSTGYAEIERDVVTVLTDACEEASKIDTDRAKRALSEAQAGLQTTGPEQAGYAELIRRAARAQARIDAASRRS